MIRALMILIPIIATIGAAGGVGYGLGLRRRPGPTTEAKTLKAASKLHEIATGHQMMGDELLAHSYRQAADLLLELGKGDGKDV